MEVGKIGMEYFKQDKTTLTKWLRYRERNRNQKKKQNLLCKKYQVQTSKSLKTMLEI